MLKKNGDGMTVKYEDVGMLAKEMYKRLLPLKDGPFGGDDQPVSKAVSAIYMEINDGPLSKETFDDVDAFIASLQTNLAFFAEVFDAPSP